MSDNQSNSLFYKLLGNLGYLQLSLVDRQYQFYLDGGAGGVAPGADPGTGYMALLTAPVGSHSADLSWDFSDDPDPTHDSFEIERKEAGGSYTQIATPASGVFNYTDSTMEPGKFYTFRVRAIISGVAQDWSNESVVKTPDALPVTDLSISATGSSTVDLAWTKPSGFVTGYDVYDASDDSLIDTVAGSAETYQVENLSPETSYSFYIVAVYNGTDSTPSNTVSTTTDVAPPAEVYFAAFSGIYKIADGSATLVHTPSNSNHQPLGLTDGVGGSGFIRTASVSPNVIYGLDSDFNTLWSESNYEYPTASSGRLFARSDTDLKTFYELSTVDRSIVKTRTFADVNDNIINYLYAPDNGFVYVALQGGVVHKYDETDITLAPTWSFTSSNGVRSILLRDGFIYIVNDDGAVYKIDDSSGTQEWTLDVATTQAWSVAVDSTGRVFVGSGSGTSGKLSVVTSAGVLDSTLFTNPNNELIGNLVVDSADNLYVTDSGANPALVRVYDSDLNLTLDTTVADNARYLSMVLKE